MLVINFGLNKPILAMLDESVNASWCNHSESMNSLDKLEQLIINEQNKYLECRNKYLESRNKYLESRNKFEQLIISKRKNCLDSREKAEQIIISRESQITRIELLNFHIDLILKQL